MSEQPPGTNRDLDARVALNVFGTTYEWLHGDYLMTDPEDAVAYLICPYYSTNIVSAFAVEERIIELGLTEQYAYNLVQIILGGSAFGFLNRGDYENQAFAIAHAPPRERCLAALQTLERNTSAS